jgi:hypothetical protein
MSNDGTSPSKQFFNNALDWVEYFNTYNMHGYTMISKNEDSWGLSETEIEYEMI